MMAENTASCKSLNIKAAVFSLLLVFAFFSLQAGSAYAAPPADIASRSIIYNDGTESISIYLLMKIQWYNAGTSSWVDEATVYQSSGPITIPPAGTLNLSTYFNGNWNTNSATRGAGTYRVWAGAHNSTWNLLKRQDNTPIEAADNFTITSPDNPPSFVSINNPSGGATINGILTVSATAADDNGISKIDFYIDGTFKASDNLAPYEYVIDTTLYNNGIHTINATAYDTIGQANSTKISVTVGNIINSPPSLSWTGEPNYISDGLNPDTGDTSTQFEFRISYSDPDTDPAYGAPAIGYPKLHIFNTSREILGSPFSMTALNPADTVYTDGKIYYYVLQLPAETYRYYFETYDAQNARVQTSTINNAPIVSQLTTPTVSLNLPVSGAVDVPLFSTINLTFSEAMNPAATLSAVSANPAILWTTSWNPLSTSLTLTPTANLQASTQYTITVGTGAQSAKGKNMAASHVFSFNTSVPLTINVISPDNKPYNANKLMTNISLDRAAGWCDVYLNEGIGQHMTSATSSLFYLNVNVPKEGRNNASFECSDNVGNRWMTQKYYFDMDTVKPNLVFSSPTNTTMDASSIDVAITSNEDLQDAVLEWNDTSQNISMSGSGKSWTVTKGGPLTYGNHPFKVFGTDLAGNINVAGAWIYINTTKITYSRVTLEARDKLYNKINNAIIEAYDPTNTLAFRFDSVNSPTPKDVLNGSEFLIKYSFSGILLDLKNVVVKNNLTIQPQFVDVYNGTMPQNMNAMSPVIALDDSGIGSYSAKITMPLNGAANRILHCTSWNYLTALCNNWEINQTSDYGAIANAAQITFNVSAFDAYLAGNYFAPAFCGDGKVDAGETCSICPADVGICPVSQPQEQDSGVSGGGGNSEGSGGLQSISTIQYPTTAKITSYPRELKIIPGETLDFELNVKNVGSKTLQNIFLEIDNAWFKFDRTHIILNPGVSETIPVKVSIPAYTKLGPYPVIISLKGDAKDSVSFILSVTEKSAGLQMMDTEIIRKGIEDVKQRIKRYSDLGYNTTSAKELAGKAEELFTGGDYLSSGDYVSLANGALNALDNSINDAVNNTTDKKNYLAAYVLSGIIVCLLVSIYYFYRKYLKERQANAIHAQTIAMHEQTLSKLKEKGLNADKKQQQTPMKSDENSPKSIEKSGVSGTVAIKSSESAKKEESVDMLDQDIKMDDLVKKLEEIRKKVEN